MSNIEEAMQKHEREKALQRQQQGVKANGWGGELQESSTNIGLMDEPRLLTADELEQERIIYPGGRNPGAVSAFRQLRTSLLRQSDSRNFLLMVTGVGQGAGASFVARNLAAAFALDESNTALLVDCNLPRPNSSSLALGYSDPSEPSGLTDFLESDLPQVESIIHPTGIPRMRVIPSGSLHRSNKEFFTSRRLPMLFRELLGRYPDRHIIMDVPPISESADARILAGLSNMVLLVVPYGRVTAGHIESAASVIPSDRYVGSVVSNQPA